MKEFTTVKELKNELNKLKDDDIILLSSSKSTDYFPLEVVELKDSNGIRSLSRHDSDIKYYTFKNKK